MFYVAAKLIQFVLLPSDICMLLGLAGLVLYAMRRRKAGARLLVTSIVSLCVIGATPLGLILTLPLENRFPQWQPDGIAPAGIIVLGGVISPGVSRARHEVALSGAAERITTAVTLARRFPDSLIVFSGDVESMFARRILEDLGVPASRIVLERRSRNTAGNAVYTKQLVQPRPGQRWLLVTSAIHMPRAVGAFRKAGFPVEPVPVDYTTTDWSTIWLLPDSLLAGIDRTDAAVHEWLGLAGYWLMGRSSALFPQAEATGVVRP
jgi:uncharacterized SAM-binding protein YcdF (DUF218 family)